MFDLIEDHLVAGPSVCPAGLRNFNCSCVVCEALGPEPVAADPQGIRLVEQPGGPVSSLSVQKREENGEHPATAPYGLEGSATPKCLYLRWAPESLPALPSGC